MLLRQQIKTFELLIMSIILLPINGCTKKLSPEDKFLASLIENPIIETDGDGLVALGPSAAKLFADDAIRAGVDLMSAYKTNLNNQTLRQQLAYLMLVSENEEYLKHVETKMLEAITSHELYICAHVLEDNSLYLDYDFEQRLVSVLLKSDEIYALISIGHYFANQGKYEDATSYALKVFNSNHHWSFQFYDILKKVPDAMRRDALLPYLESDTKRGITVASFLAQDPECKIKAMNYLERLANSNDTDLAHSALSDLDMLKRFSEFEGGKTKGRSEKKEEK